MKIAFFEIQGWEKKYITKALKGQDLSFSGNQLTADNVDDAKDAEVVSTFIYSKVDSALIQNLPDLKLIATRSTGFDHIDVGACKKRGVAVCNVPFYGENTVAEHTFALILSLSRNVHKSYLRAQKNDFSIEGLKGFDLKGKTLGVVGAGHIGLHVIRIAKGFGMEVLAYDTHQDKFLSEVLGFKYAPMDTLLAESDIVTLHVPYNDHTHHMINKGTIAQMKKGAIIINTSRGAVIDTDALIEALDKKIIAGAGLDVLEGEELIKEEKQLLYDTKKVDVFARLVKDHILLSKDNVVFTPHMAFYSNEALERIIDTTNQNILAFLAGKKMNEVN